MASNMKQQTWCPCLKSWMIESCWLHHHNLKPGFHSERLKHKSKHNNYFFTVTMTLKRNKHKHQDQNFSFFLVFAPMLAFELQEVKTKYRSGVTQTQGYLSHVFKFGQWKQCIQISSRLNSLECVDDCVCIEFSFPGAIPSISRFPEDNAQQNLVYFSSSVQYANGCENVFRLNMQSQCSIPNGKKKRKISRRRSLNWDYAENRKEIYRDFYRMCTAIVLFSDVLVASVVVVCLTPLIMYSTKASGAEQTTETDVSSNWK